MYKQFRAIPSFVGSLLLFGAGCSDPGEFGLEGEDAAELADDDDVVAAEEAVTDPDLTLAVVPVGPSESQCGGTWDVKDVESYADGGGVSKAFVLRHERRVGYDVTRGCSGTLISDDLFLSAGHCQYAVGHVVRFDYQNDANGSPRPTRDFTVAAVVEQEWNDDWDYAIVRLNGSPGREFGHASIAAVDPPVYSTVTLIQHPDGVPKKVHSGPVLDYAAEEGPNWFRHQVDTTYQSSGSGVLNAAGELVGVHTNAGCSTGSPIGGNSAMRMSRLVVHSPTLQALTRSKILWRDNDGRISIWSIDAAGKQLSYAEAGPHPAWTPISLSNNRVLWRHTDGRISLWTINDKGQQTGYKEYGPYSGWTAVNYANDRILWKHTNGAISLWSLDSAGNVLGYKEHGPFSGWSVVNYANNRLVWRHTSGKISLWRLDDSGKQIGYVESGPFLGWTPVKYDNGELLFRHDSGASSVWSVDRSGNQLSYKESAPGGTWAPADIADRRLMWKDGSGRVSYWKTNSDGVQMNYVEYGPIAGWTALLTAGGRP